MSNITRRSLLLGATALGAGTILHCAPRAAPAPAPPPVDDAPAEITPELLEAVRAQYEPAFLAGYARPTVDIAMVARMLTAPASPPKDYEVSMGLEPARVVNGMEDPFYSVSMEQTGELMRNHGTMVLCQDLRGLPRDNDGVLDAGHPLDRFSFGQAKFRLMAHGFIPKTLVIPNGTRTGGCEFYPVHDVVATGEGPYDALAWMSSTGDLTMIQASDPEWYVLGSTPVGLPAVDYWQDIDATSVPDFDILNDVTPAQMDEWNARTRDPQTDMAAINEGHRFSSRICLGAWVRSSLVLRPEMIYAARSE